VIRPTFLVLLATLAAACPASAATFTVTNTNTSGAGSLAKAITDANATHLADVIQFLIPSLGTVTINGPFPAIAMPLSINGYTQFGANESNALVGTNADIRVQLNASTIGAAEALLQVNADDTTIRGVSIIGLGEKQIGIRVAAGAEDVVIDGCFIGTPANGTTDSSGGIGIRNDGTGTLIGGGTTVGKRNLISGNDTAGIDERGIGTIIANNLIGTDWNAEESIPNGRGIVVSSSAADDILIGGDAVYSSNLIAGNDGEGIDVLTTVVGNVQIVDNSFRDNGALAIDLGSDGVTRNDESDADFGPNHQQNYPVLTFARRNGSVVEVEGYLPVPPNMYRLEFYTARDRDPSGFGEGETLIAILSPTTSGTGFHFRYSIELDGPPMTDPFYVTATAQNMSTLETSEFSNSIEVLPGGTERVVTNSNDAGAGSLRAAIEAANAAPGPDTITFEIPDPPQQINLQSSLTVTEEVIIDGFTQQAAKPNTLSFGSNTLLKVEVDGSDIGTGGTFVVNADRFIVRGLAINGKGIGVQYSTGGFGRIEGCYVGTNLAGTAADGNNSHGIFTGAEAHSITIGGDLPSQRNIVSGNSTHGMRVTGDDAVIMGNIVGADATGLAPIPNGFNGISIEGWNVNVGHDDFNHTGQNVSAFNVQDGIAVSSVAQGVTILGNSISGNGDLGIDLSVGDAPGVTPNDSDDDDDGANRLQNFPVITLVTTTGGSTTVEGVLDVASDVTAGEFVIRVYSSPECDPSGHGEGKLFRGAETVVLSDADETFSVTVAKGLTAESFIAVTATDVQFGNTSEFSECGSLDTSPPLCGDTSGNDEITTGDALSVLRRAVGTFVCPDCICDVNSNGSVTTTDALLVLRLAVGQPVDLDCPICMVIPI